MSTMQINACLHPMIVRSTSPFLPPSCNLQTSHTCISSSQVKLLYKTVQRPVLKAANCQKLTPLCLFGGKGKPENNNESSPWKALEKAIGGFKKELTVQDLLRQQMMEKELEDGDGGSGNRLGGGGDGSGGSEDEDFSETVDEIVQVLLATLAFIFLYIYIINGEEINRIAVDFLRLLSGGGTSMRLRRIMYVCGRFFQHITKKKSVQSDWLERAILTTNTWWYTPRLYRRMKRRLAAAESYSQ